MKRNSKGQFVEGDNSLGGWNRGQAGWTNSGSFKKGQVPHNWKGDAVGYVALHKWLEAHFGKPMICWNCGDTSRKMYDWANISREYKRVFEDWIRLCRSCHKLYDLGKISVEAKYRETE